MKRLKADILSIRPVFSSNDPAGDTPEQIEDLPFEVLVQNYYKKKFQTDMDAETLELLLEIMREEETS